LVVQGYYKREERKEHYKQQPIEQDLKFAEKERQRQGQEQEQE
jgi:hypothetical protein